MRRIFYFPLFILLFLSAIVSLHSYTTAKQEEAPVIQHAPISSFVRGETINIEASISAEVEWMRFFFRNEGVEEFQARNMEKSNGVYVCQLDTSQLASLQLEYYLVAKISDREVYFPVNAPAETFKVSGESEQPLPEIPSELPSPQEEEKKFQLPISGSGSIQARLAQKETMEGEKRVTADGNIRVFHSYQGDFNLDIDSNFYYTSAALEGDKNFDLSNMMVSFSKDNHTFRAGDINISESEYTVSGLGRRGVEYVFDNQTTYVHLFDVSTQQAKGFEGFGIPKSGISVLGGALGYKFLDEKASVKAIFLGGKDDPSQGVNTGFTPTYESRKGNAFALIQEATLFKDKLNLQAEFGRTSYDEDLSDEQDAVSGTAFNIGGNFSHGIINLGTRYRYVGGNFNPIGYQTYTNDRRGYDTSFGLNYKSINLTASYAADNDNVKNDPTGYTTKNRNGGVNFSVGLSDKVILDLGYNRDKQRTFQGDVETALQDSLTNEYRGSLNVTASPSANFSISLSNSVLSSENDPTVDISTITLNLTGSFRAGEILTLSPALGYSHANKKFTTGDSETYNSFLSGEVVCIPQVLSMFFTGSFNRVVAGAFDITNTAEIGGGLNLKLSELIKIASLTFSLRGNYRKTKATDFSDSDYSLLFQCDFSF